MGGNVLTFYCQKAQKHGFIEKECVFFQEFNASLIIIYHKAIICLGAVKIWDEFLSFDEG
jgi:hypothetical protein